VTHHPARAEAHYAGALPDDLLAHLAAHAREAELQVDETAGSLRVFAPHAEVALHRAPDGLRIAIAAADAVTLQNIRGYLLHMLDHAAPGLADAATWQGEVARAGTPLNFCTARLRRVRRVAPRFLRVELDCPDTPRLAAGRGMHFSLLLPPPGRAPVWPSLDGNGRTVMPSGADALHRAVYTFVDLDPEAERFTFDVFEHEGGRATEWARNAAPGETVGISGPGSGDFPPGREILLAGDETALPAIRRILAHSAPDRRGTALLEVGEAGDICDLPRPAGIEVTWLLRSRGQALWDRLATQPLPHDPDRYVWIAAEKALVRKAKARFRGELGIGPGEGYFAYYWEA